MQTAVISENVTLSLPQNDLNLLRSLAKKMGWVMRVQRKSGIEKGLEDVRKGNVFQAKNSGKEGTEQPLSFYRQKAWEKVCTLIKVGIH